MSSRTIVIIAVLLAVIAVFFFTGDRPGANMMGYGGHNVTGGSMPMSGRP